MNARSLAITRAVAVIGGTGALIVGATLASTTTNAVTAAGTVNVSDNLLISASHTPQGGYSTSASGFTFNTAPASPSVTPTDIWLETSEPASTVVLSAKITANDTNLAADASHLTVNFKLGGNSQSVPYSTLASGDTPLTSLGALPNSGLTNPGTNANDLQVSITADASTPALSALNTFTLQLTGTNNGTVGP